MKAATFPRYYVHPGHCPDAEERFQREDNSMKAKCLFGFCVMVSMLMASPGDLGAQTGDDSGSKRKLELEMRNEAEREEAASYRKKLATANPYHDSALVALRELSGQDAGPSPDAWRKLLAPPNPRAKVR
jgi:hypothetical protein